MGTRNGYGSGTFCWINLSSTDPELVKRFYTQLFGWEYVDPIGDGGFSMARRYDANVAAIYEREEEERARGLPPHWNNYITVRDADAAAALTVNLGGAVFDPPFDVSDAGRTAVLIDPTGAMFWVWQPHRHIGAGHVNDPGCLTFNELRTTDPEHAIEFYTSLFDWSFERIGSTEDRSGCWVIGNGTAAMGINGGMRELRDDDAHPQSTWIPYFTVESAASTVSNVEAFGGELWQAPAPVGTDADPDTGTGAVVSDPEGAVFGVFEGQVDD